MRQVGEQARDHGAAGARDAGEQRQDLRRADADRGADAQPVEPGAFVFEGDRAAPHALADEHDDAVDDQEGRGGSRVSEEALYLLLEQDADQAGRHRSGDQPPAEALVRGAVHAAVDQAANHGLDDGDPVPPEVNEQCRSGADVQQDDECEERWVGLVEVPAEQLREDDRMTQTADWKELRDALQ